MLNAGQDYFGCIDHTVRDAGQPGHLNAVAAVGSAFDNFSQEDDVIPPFLDDNVVIPDTFPGCDQFCQLVLMRGKKGPHPRSIEIMEVFRYSPGDAQSVKCTRTASDFVEDDETPGRHVF